MPDDDLTRNLNRFKSLGIEIIIILQRSKVVCSLCSVSDGKQMQMQMQGVTVTAALLAPQSWKEAHFKMWCNILSYKQWLKLKIMVD